MTRQSNSRYFLLDTIPTDDDKILNGAKLPTRKEVLLSFLAYHETEKNIRDAANKTVDQVQLIFSKARIPTIQNHKMAEKIETLFREMKSLLKINLEKRQNKKQQAKIDNFKMKLKQTMIFWPRNALQLVKNKEDKEFLVCMMNDRKGFMAGIDRNLSLQETNIRKRKMQEQERQSKQLQETLTPAAVLLSSSDGSADEEQPSCSYQHPKSTRSHKRVKKTGLNLTIPHDILQRPRLVQSLIRNNVSSTAISSIMQELTSELDEEAPSKLSISYASAERHRQKAVESIANETQNQWIPPNVANIQWDEKLMPTINAEDGTEETHRLPVIISGR